MKGIQFVVRRFESWHSAYHPGRVVKAVQPRGRPPTTVLGMPGAVHSMHDPSSHGQSLGELPMPRRSGYTNGANCRLFRQFGLLVSAPGWPAAARKKRL